jgi:alkanesulfonate monooxygenase SsuD/methylene tetrahydromethanopterin reductase-like flavin-dependent oxidoreductase (luciferase family)
VRVRPIDHAGTNFSVKGPLSLPPTPQGRPVVFMAGQSAPGLELAARYADAVFGAGATKQDCIEANIGIKSRMAKYGRATSQLKFLPGVSVFTGRTAAEADRLYQELQDLISPALGVHYLAKMLQYDLDGHDLDGPLPADIPEQVLGGSSLRRYMLDMGRRDRLTIRQLYQSVLPALGGPVFKGDPNQVADQMEDWFKSGACDGFTIMAPTMPGALRDFVDLVIPELRRRGLFRQSYETTTLRGHLGLDAPPSQWTQPDRQAAAECFAPQISGP